MNDRLNKKSSQSAQSKPIEIPSLSLNINYEDIGGSKYNKEFDVNFTIFSTTHHVDITEGAELVQGMFEFIEKP